MRLKELAQQLLDGAITEEEFNAKLFVILTEAKSTETNLTSSFGHSETIFVADAIIRNVKFLEMMRK